MQHSSAVEAARMLSEAWRTGDRFADLPPGLRPASWEEVYRIQDAVIDLQGAIGGWKVAPVDRGEGRICVPIPASYVHESPALLSVAAFGPELEVEIGVRLARDLLDTSRDYTPKIVSEAIGSLHLAIEVVGSRFLDRKAVDHMTAIADLGNNAGIVMGPPVTDWRSIEVGTVAMRLTIDGGKVGSSDGGWSTAEMIEALAALATHAVRRSGGLKAGQVVITGARIQPVPAKLNAQIEAAAPGFGPVRLSIR